MTIGNEHILSEPLWRAEDLGRPIPDSPHAVSVCLPRWADVIGYEEREPRVIDAMKTGYPRFFHHPACCKLFSAYERRCGAADGVRCLVFPSRYAAERCAVYVRATGEHAEARAPASRDAPPNVHAVCVGPDGYEAAKEYWRHTGEGVSSRLAERCLTGDPPPDDPACKPRLRQRIAQFAGVEADDVWLFPTGMAAIFTLHRALRGHRPEARSVQFGFPYVDTLKILEKFGPGAHFFPRGSDDELVALEGLLTHEPVAGIFTEVPANPLLVTPDLARLSEAARRHDAPLVVDDTIATWLNADVLELADATCTSLTKFFSGVGDVAGGCVVLNRRGPRYAMLREGLEAVYEDLVDDADAAALDRNSGDFAQRMVRINANAERVATFLHEHPRVQTVYYPMFQTPERYASLRRRGGGFGGLLSLVLRDGERAAPRFYDRLPVCKGPNLGTNYTLACPYTMIAHYHELAFAASCGVAAHLVRMSVGLEDADQLIDAIGGALET